MKDESLKGEITGLAGGLRPPGGTEDLAYQGYVSGELLDQRVDVERTSFDFDDLLGLDPNTRADGAVIPDGLLKAAIAKVREFLEPILEPILEANRKRIKSEIEEHYPGYRYLLKRKANEVAAIAPDVEGGELDLALYRIEQRLDIESRESIRHELAQATDPDEPPDERHARMDQLLETINDAGMSKLARHVAHRRTVIEFGSCAQAGVRGIDYFHESG